MQNNLRCCSPEEFPPIGTLLIVKHHAFILDPTTSSTGGPSWEFRMWPKKETLEVGDPVLFLGAFTHEFLWTDEASTIFRLDVEDRKSHLVVEHGFKLLHEGQIIAVKLSQSPVNRVLFDNLFFVHQQ